MVRCKDYFIIKVRCYADEKLLKNWDNPETRKQHHQRAILSNELFWSLFTKLTNIEQMSYHREYMFETKECAIDEIAEKGVLILHGEGWDTYLLPVNNISLLHWFMGELKAPHKVMSKVNLWYFRRISKLSKILRDESRQNTIEFKAKHGITF